MSNKRKRDEMEETNAEETISNRLDEMSDEEPNNIDPADDQSEEYEVLHNVNDLINCFIAPKTIKTGDVEEKKKARDNARKYEQAVTIKKLNMTLETLPRDETLNTNLLSELDTMLNEDKLENYDLPTPLISDPWKMITTLKKVTTDGYNVTERMAKMLEEKRKSIQEAYTRLVDMVNNNVGINETDEARLNINTALFFKSLMVPYSKLSEAMLKDSLKAKHFMFIPTNSEALIHAMKESFNLMLNESFDHKGEAHRTNSMLKLMGNGITIVKEKANGPTFYELYPECKTFLNVLFYDLICARVPAYKDKISKNVFFNLSTRKLAKRYPCLDEQSLKIVDRELFYAHVSISDIFFQRNRNQTGIHAVVVMYINYILTDKSRI